MIKDIQKRLAALGYTPGPIDGIWGRKSMAAVRLFQTKHQLEPDGIAGAITLAALFPDHVAATARMDDPGLIWLQEARRLLGTRERPGVGSNPAILDWASTQGIPYRGDDIPWCGLFVGHCISATLDREPTPTGLLAARSWERFGILTAPTSGAVLVFWRQSLASGLGHVGFYAGEDQTAYRVLGGNQSDSVSLAWVPKDRLISARWPSTVPPPVPEAVIVARTDTLSWNEA